MKKNSTVAIWSYTEHKFLKMYSEGPIGASPLIESGQLPSNWESEKFLIVDAGYDKVAFWSPLRKCFLKMYPYGFMGMSPVCESGELPQN